MECENENVVQSRYRETWLFYPSPVGRLFTEFSLQVLQLVTFCSPSIFQMFLNKLTACKGCQTVMMNPREAATIDYAICYQRNMYIFQKSKQFERKTLNLYHFFKSIQQLYFQINFHPLNVDRNWAWLLTFPLDAGFRGVRMYASSPAFNTTITKSVEDRTLPTLCEPTNVPDTEDELTTSSEQTQPLTSQYMLQEKT